MDPVDWNCISQSVISIISQHPDKDLNINPHSITGQITDGAPEEPMFNCTLLSTPLKRNLFRLLSSLLFRVLGVQLGVPTLPHTQLTAANDNCYIEREFIPFHDAHERNYEDDTKGLRHAIRDVRRCLFDDVLRIEAPVHFEGGVRVTRLMR
ncbi:hypothetical protein ElyMa_005789200 [Elysia marginata]|uniref:Uncharacterized protein n=1 Tax=Elysia marginata TaxID=1093978 RepID=A0AAV4FRL7_9GAST|nr:hypothetical protein ElyMa_005789200 [Elysia marginata]